MTDKVAHCEIYHSPVPVISASSVFEWADCLPSCLNKNYIFKNKLQVKPDFTKLQRKRKLVGEMMQQSGSLRNREQKCSV